MEPDENALTIHADERTSDEATKERFVVPAKAGIQWLAVIE